MKYDRELVYLAILQYWREDLSGFQTKLKVGVSKRPNLRLIEIAKEYPQKTWDTPTYIFTDMLLETTGNNARYVEDELHGILAVYQDTYARRNGLKEWFDYSWQDYQRLKMFILEFKLSHMKAIEFNDNGRMKIVIKNRHKSDAIIALPDVCSWGWRGHTYKDGWQRASFAEMRKLYSTNEWDASVIGETAKLLMAINKS